MQPGKETLHALEAKMKLSLSLFMRLAVNDVPIALQILHLDTSTTKDRARAVPLPNFPQMSLISNGILGFFGISLASRDLLVQPNQAGFIYFFVNLKGGV